MLVREVMTDHAVFVHPDTPVEDVAKKMRELDCGSLPIGEDDRLVGFVTDRDIVVRSTADGNNPSDTHARDVMTDKVVYCYDTDKVTDASKLMKENQVRRLIVLNEDKRMVGMLSMGDLATETDPQIVGDTAEKVYSDHHPA